MIVIGYQGIGKTSFRAKHENCIDLESGLMKDPMNENKRWNNWAEIYCNIALSLSGQGYTVFVSSHKEVQDILAESDEDIVAIYPSTDIKNEWIEKLFKRYKQTQLEKDEIAWLDAKKNFDSEIALLEKSPFVRATIYNMDYNLHDILSHVKYNFKAMHDSRSKQATK